MSSRDSDFERLLCEHSRLIAAAIGRVCGQRHRILVEDVEQEVRLALWKRLGDGKEIRHPVSYLYKMALTTALAIVRRYSREQRPLPEGDPYEPPEVGGEQVLGLDPAERRRLIDELLGKLDADAARALRAWLAGFGHTEIATMYGWTPSVARHRIYRSLERLRRAEEERTSKEVGVP